MKKSVDNTRTIWVITRSVDGSEWGLSSAENMAKCSALQTDVYDEPLILVKIFETSTNQEAKKEMQKIMEQYQDQNTK